MKIKHGDDDNSNDTRNTILASTLSMIIVGGIWFLYWFWINSTGWESIDKGQFGDMFGAINALFTGLAFGGLIVTIIFQSKELKLQRMELIETRDVFKKQNATLEYQRFDNTFFNLVQQYNSLDKKHFSVVVTGRLRSEEFKNNSIHGQLQDIYNRPQQSDTFERVNTTMSRDTEDELRAHIQSFESIVEFIDNFKRDSRLRLRYFKFFLSQLTNFEVAVYFYHFYLRPELLPVAFSEYSKILIDSAHLSPQVPPAHSVTIVNGSKGKIEKAKKIWEVEIEKED